MESGPRRPLSLLRWRTQCQLKPQTSRPARARVQAVAVGVALAVSLGALTTTSTRAVAADPRSELEAVRKRVDAIAEQYFAAQEKSRTIVTEIESLSRKLDSAKANIRSIRNRAVQTAINVYRSQPRGFEGSSAESTLDAARSAVFTQQSIARDNEAINAYVQAVAKLRDDNQLLIRRQDEARRNEARLKAEAAALDAALANAQAKYAALLRAQAAQRAADAAAKNATPTTRPGSQPNATNPTTPPSNGSPGTGTTRTTQPTTATTTPPPPPPAGTNAHHNDPFLACVRQRESRGYYGAVNPSGYYGAYQFAIRTWDTTASHAGRPQLIGVRPDRASPWDQDELAWVLYQWQGKGPWGGNCG